MTERQIDGFRGRVVPAGRLTKEEIATWDSFCRQYSDLTNAFLSPHYCLSVAACRPDVYVGVIEKDQEIVGFFPFQFRTRAHAVLGFAERVGEEMTDYFGLVARPDLRLESTSLLRLVDVQYLSFTHLEETQLRYGLAGAAPEIGHQMKIKDPMTYWQELRTTHKKFVANADRGWRQIESQLGPLKFTPEADRQTELTRLIDCKSQQYNKSGRPDLFTTTWKKNLLHRLAGLGEGTCSGMLSTLYAGDTWVASHFGIRCQDVLHYWFPVYNPELQRFGPGRLLIKAFIDASENLGIHVIDRGAGTAPHKAECSNHTHTYYRGIWRRAGVRSSLARVAESARWRMERWRTSS